MMHTPTAAEQCAALALDLAPLLMRLMRQELNAHKVLDLNIAQFRTLRYIARHPTTSLSDVAEHLGMTLPAASKLVDRLWEQELVTRSTASDDRRRTELILTVNGRSALDLAVTAAQARLAASLAELPEQTLEGCMQALSIVRACVAPIAQTRESGEGQ